MLKFAEMFGATDGSDETFANLLQLSFPAPAFVSRAFEENRLFVYAAAEIPQAGPGNGSQVGAERPFHLTRRLIFLKPSTFLLDDDFEATPSTRRPAWCLDSREKPLLTDQRAIIAEEQSELLYETLLPDRVTRKLRREPRGPASYTLEVQLATEAARLRVLHLLHARRRGDDEIPLVQASVENAGGPVDVAIRTKRRAFRMILPPVADGAGTIEISRSDGKPVLLRRLFPSGKLPHGVKGVALLEQWDADYRGAQPPLWDAGRPCIELINAVESGTIRPCRVIELGCGSGTDAVYLAGRGFDVTAIDIAPSALRLAQEKAAKANVTVRWLLADVLALPNLGPFDFIYDRGCYHELRAHNLREYLETTDRLSRPGTRFLLLAGNANEPVVDYGPPRVTEEELRGDFSALFDFEWLRESRFEIARHAAIGPLAWSALLRRK
jgi:SAM-dependent methyltransferase